MLELKSELLCELVGDLDDPQLIGQTPRGGRMIFPVHSHPAREKP
ncbi:MAG: hypothetical protein AB1585_12390 [Thermodesulfobacteriota bacterium]